MEGHRFALIAFGPVRLNFNTLLCVCERFCVLLHGVVRCGAVPEDGVVIRRFDESLCVVVDGLGEIFDFKGFVALIFV